MNQQALALATNYLDAEQLDEPFLYHDTSRPGFTSLVTPGGRRRQESFRLLELPKRLTAIRGQSVDGYIAQNEFWRPNRRVVHCWRLTSFYLDLDTYKIPRLQNRTPESLIEELLMACDGHCIPQPTVVVFSGRGLQAKWILETPVPTHALPRWQAVQNALCSRLEPLGADPRALDASRVLRLVGTVNRRSRDIVRVVYRARIATLGGARRADGVVVYDFETFCETVLPLSRAELQRQETERAHLENAETSSREAEARRRQALRESMVVVNGGKAATAVNKGARALIPSELSWDRLHDLRRLAEMRGWHNGVPSGQRDLFVFLAACFLATTRVAPAFRAEVRELAREFAPSWTEAEIQVCTTSVLSRVEAAAKGEKIFFRGSEVDPRYRFTNARLVELLELSPAEMSSMRTIVDKTEARRRDAERKKAKRRADGCKTRAEYVGQGLEQAKRARELRDTGLSLAAIAQQLGISRTSASRYCRKP